MKTKLLSFAALTLSGLALRAAPLASTTAVHTRPDVSSPTISTLQAGTEVTSAATSTNLPAGWMAVELKGPFEAYVENKDFTKALDVKPGASIRLAPKADAAVLTTAEKGDKAVISGIRGKWTQVTLEKKLTGYVKVGTTAATTPIVPAPARTTTTATPATTTTRAPAPAPMASAPVAPSVYGSTSPGQAAPMVNLGDGGSSTLPRQFAGKLVSTRRALSPRRPYDYALNDDAGKRYAYVDISKLLQTEQIEKFIDHRVVVFGAAKPVPDSKDIVIMVETLQLK